MKQITIDFKNAFDCSKKEKSKVCRSGYVRLVRFMDDKKHTRPQVYEGDLLEAIMDVAVSFPHLSGISQCIGKSLLVTLLPIGIFRDIIIIFAT